MASGPFERLDQTARMAAHLFGALAAFVSLVGVDAVRLVGRHGITDRVACRYEAFGSSTVQGEEPLIVTDALLDESFSNLPTVRGGVRFHAGAPVTDAVSGQRRGSSCIIENLDRGQRDALVGMAHLVSCDLATPSWQAGLVVA